MNNKELAIKCFNNIWTILDKFEPSESDKLEAIRLAHTSTWLWKKEGTAINQQRGEWICSRVYVTFGHIESALFHANNCYNLTVEHKFNDFDLFYSYEALARVYQKLQNKEKFNKYFKLAEESLEEIKEIGDKQQCIEDLKTLK